VASALRVLFTVNNFIAYRISIMVLVRRNTAIHVSFPRFAKLPIDPPGTSKHKLGFTGPCPPSGQRRYFARLYALRKQLDLPPGAAAMEVKMTLEGKVIEQTELMGILAKSNGQWLFLHDNSRARSDCSAVFSIHKEFMITRSNNICSRKQVLKILI
jgi:hypothetical protein